MENKDNDHEVPFDDFARRFAIRAKNLMWFLGAGASASAGLPTAIDMIWEFKQSLFLSQNPGSGYASSNLSDPIVRNRIDAHLKSIDGLPPPGAPNEYAALFEAAYPAESDRRTILDAKLSGAKPSYGHVALGTFMCHGQSRVVWTTNFDSLVADACAKVYGTTSALTSIDLDSASQAQQLLADERWPIEIKLHGDFRSRRLKNTDDELRHQDAHLRSILVDTSKRFGLIVCGYSGRDDSVMDALEEAIAHENSFPAGFFWLHRGDEPPLPRVAELLRHGIANNVEAAIVRVENFDETMRDLVRLSKDIDTAELDQFAPRESTWTPAPRQRATRRGWPVVRLNAVPVIDAPTQCRRLDCEIGGTAEVREAVQKAGVDVLAVRSQIGVLAFGDDEDVRNAFDSYGIRGFDLHAFDPRRQRYDSTERGLLSDALNRGIGRCRALHRVHRHNFVPAEPGESTWDMLRDLTGQLFGNVKGNPDLQWREGISVRLDWANDRLWLLIEPRTVFEGITESNKMAATDFARERTIRRYNPVVNNLVDFWSRHLAEDGKEMRTFDTGAGIDAVFRLSPITCFSRKATS